MCGIAGRFSAHHLSEDADWAGHASRLLAHRGPNGSGHLVDEYCELVHRRLSIIDLSDNGKQPMANEDESIHVIFNGEIYNYKKLREELKAKGHRFKSQTDTEVLVHLYEEYQEDMVNLIEGMFAFAIYDKPKKQLLLARDRFGIKPLYYATLGNQCVFGSEIKAILALKSLSPTLNHQACYDYLQLGYIPEPTTGFLEINALPKGHLLVVNKNKSSLTKYYQIKVSVNPLYDMSQSVDVGASLLSEAVENQAFADVTVGALLSGGIDSSLVVSAYARSQRKKPLTFSIGFSDKNYDETSIANQVSRHLNTQHHVTHIENNTISLDNILKLFLHLDQPFADTSMIPMNYAAQAIRNHGIKCAFSGDGGDEVFGGYARFWRANYFYTIASLPAYCQGLLKYIAAVVIRCNPDLGRQMTKAIRLAQRGHKDTAYLLAGLSSWINQEQAEQLLENNNSNKYLSVQRHFETRTQDGKNNLEKLSSAMTENLFDIGLPSDMLRKVDMMSMLEGVEIRVPMLSENLVSFGLTLNHQMKTDGKKGKMVLRQIAKRQLPEAVAAHKKHGFSIPMDVVFDKSIHQKLNDLLLSKDSRTSDFLNRDIVKKWISLFKQSKTRANHEEISRAGLYQRIFIAMALELWLREHRLTW